MEIPIHQIYVSDRIRKKIEKVPELAISIKENGQIHSIVVRPTTVAEREEKDVPWALVAGGRRLAAVTLLDLPTIRAEDFGHLSPFRQKAIELEENLQREEMHFADVVAAKQRLHELYKEEAASKGEAWNIEDTAKAIGESVANLSKDIALAKEVEKNPELRKATSKKAAVTSVKFSGHAKRVAADSLNGAAYAQMLRRNIVTAEAQTWLDSLEEGSVDLPLVDLPYGIDYFDLALDSTGEASALHKFDDSAETTKDLLADIIPKLIRVTKKSGWIVLFTGWEGYFYARDLIGSTCAEHYEYIDPDSGRCIKGEKKRACRALKLPPKPWIWYRPNSRNHSNHPDLHAKNQYEPILVVNRGEGKLSGLEASEKGNVLVYDSDYSERIHAHQKPLPLLEDLIERFTQMNQKVIDCCFGSGSTLAAAAKTSREFAGCDSNPNMLNPAIGFVAQFYKGE